MSKTENGFRFRFRLHKVTFWGSKNEKLVFVFSFSLHKGRPKKTKKTTKKKAIHEQEDGEEEPAEEEWYSL